MEGKAGSVLTCGLLLLLQVPVHRDTSHQGYYILSYGNGPAEIIIQTENEDILFPGLSDDMNLGASYAP